MTPPAPPSPSTSPRLSARIIHSALVLGVLLFLLVAWRLGETEHARPLEALPHRRVLYAVLFLLSLALFGAARFAAARLAPRPRAASLDDWWRQHLPRVIVIWALVEAPAVLGIAVYVLTRDFRTLIATLAGLVFFAQYAPGRLAGRE